MTPRARLFWAVLALLPAGCGSDPYKTAPVSGRVTLDSKALANATLQFVPVDAGKDGAPLPSSVGTTDDDGRYSLVLQNPKQKPGAVVGKHRVYITLGAQGSGNETRPTFHKQLPEQYNRKSKLECEVPADGRDDANFDLKSK
jgi:hypothetical protein